ncbi:hypothetical protein NK553_18405 [Pseudomonas sp. ZM23]|uniref:Tail terminator n=1 Tax=Pseudomonas triclosanedens TaxID=2961893 RepID=A0ABY6ZRM5_9PSED|nr:hypothetical protein [Pseudomonas triclosanedens]MCP8465927.1 hypothetical protein [Pseudomonas triclosanedens]MCP8472248.1 hypothetical protein [Pseudomonas triclosanedens]MCP8477226.1 hypothetical protein [Pseudomonas triclosanedens]WAI47436.1 hypothetical protein OU419_16810 [Pseudomonas triclosanedens]
MSSTKASEVAKALRERLGEIRPENGYFTAIDRVYGPTERARDKAPMPYLLVRTATDSRTGAAKTQASRVRTFEIEAVFGKSAEEADLDNIHVDVLRALGFGRDDFDGRFPGLIEDQDDAVPQYAGEGRDTHNITITIGVAYVENYN